MVFSVLGYTTDNLRQQARAQQQGHTVHAADGLIAATALRHGLHVMTRNVSDFEPTGALLINPCPNDQSAASRRCR